MNEELWKTLSPHQWIPVLHQLLLDIQDAEELVIRASAALGMRRFVDRVGSAAEGEGEEEKDKAKGRRLDVFGREKGGMFGHLREVGPEGYVAAVEKEESGVWVVVHIFEPVCPTFHFNHLIFIAPYSPWTGVISWMRNSRG